jgi:hypothetical protein
VSAMTADRFSLLNKRFAFLFCSFSLVIFVDEDEDGRVDARVGSP